ncbi:MAG: nitroreductase family protein [Peptoniphilus sp.]|nr:nitroreductase family protein [Peptoniphilus sp.]
MNKTLELFERHKTIRKFKRERISAEELQAILQAYRRSPSSLGLQASTIIHVTDQKLKEEITKISEQEYVADVPELFIFVADLYRGRKVAEQKGYENLVDPSVEMLIQGFTDSIIGAQSLSVAAESLGLGVVYLGSLLKDYEKLIELLKLPKYTFPVIGMGVGYPDQEPQLKPKMSMEHRCFENEYKSFDNYLDEFKELDDEMHNYYDTRDENRRSDTFTNQLSKFYDILSKGESKAVEVLRKQGFRI